MYVFSYLHTSLNVPLQRIAKSLQSSCIMPRNEHEGRTAGDRIPALASLEGKCQVVKRKRVRRANPGLVRGLPLDMRDSWLTGQQVVPGPTLLFNNSSVFLLFINLL